MMAYDTKELGFVLGRENGLDVAGRKKENSFPNSRSGGLWAMGDKGHGDGVAQQVKGRGWTGTLPSILEYLASMW